jgi:hypothetical protein
MQKQKRLLLEKTLESLSFFFRILSGPTACFTIIYLAYTQKDPNAFDTKTSMIVESIIWFPFACWIEYLEWDNNRFVDKRFKKEFWNDFKLKYTVLFVISLLITFILNAP